MSATRKNVEIAKNPIRNLPELIKLVQEHKKKLKIAKIKNNSNKIKFLMRDKSGTYML